MHGRIKVRTSEEEKARKEKERQEKLKIFKHAMKNILSKRKNNEQDEEQLDITAKVLMSNPDIYTLWNIRREILTILSKIKECDEEVSKLYDSELSLTEYCLKVNPKSYCAWHQREWVLTTRTDPDWKKELDLCNTYLKLDERNFHTWDYRRFVVSQCKPPLQEEFDYTTEKLYDNFSNYSAWHYRSKMLVELFPDLQGGRPIQDNHHKHELKMVQSAAFTDPDDTSAWFYQRWLLGAVKVTIQPVVFCINLSKATVAWSKSISREYIKNYVKIFLDGLEVGGEWISATGYEYDDLWILEHNVKSLDGEVKLEHIFPNDKEVIICDKYEPNMYVGKNDISFQNQYSKPVVVELNEQLEACRQLLALEPDNRWTLLTTTVFLHCINANLYHEEVIDNLKTLKQLDIQRTGYYSDLITKWSIENQLSNNYKNVSTEYKVEFSERITSLPHIQYYSFCKTVDLSNQKLTSSILPSLVKLQHCKELNLSGNDLTTLKGFPNLNLQKLNVQDNPNLKSEEVAIFKEKHKNCIVIF